METRSVIERYAIVTQADIQEAMQKLQHSEQKNETVTQNGYNFGYSGTTNGAVANA